MTDNTKPEALDLADWLEAVGGGPSAKRCAALLREQHARIAELESELEAVGAGGVQALSAAPGEPPGIRALMCVISSLRDTAHFSDEEGELTNDLRTLRDWAYTQTAAFQPSPKAVPVTQQAGYAEVIECGNSYAKVKLKGEAFGSTKVGDIFYTALQQDEPVGEVVSASCDHATVRWLHQTSSVGGGDPRNSRAWPKVSGVSRDEGHSRALLVFFAAEPTDDEMRAVHDTLAASPTPPAEQQAPKAAPTRTALPEGWTDCTIEFGNDGPEVVAYGPKRMMNRLAKWLGKYFARVIADATPKAAPGERLTREQIREVFMANGFTVKEGQTDLKQYVYDAAHALLELVAAPQQEAQEPVAWQGVHDQTDLYYTKPLQADVRPLYTAPQPAPAPLSDDVAQKTWALIDELEKLRGADRYDEDWDTLNKRDSELRAALDAQGGKDE